MFKSSTVGFDSNVQLPKYSSGNSEFTMEQPHLPPFGSWPSTSQEFFTAPSPAAAINSLLLHGRINAAGSCDKNVLCAVEIREEENKKWDNSTAGRQNGKYPRHGRISRFSSPNMAVYWDIRYEGRDASGADGWKETREETAVWLVVVTVRKSGFSFNLPSTSERGKLIAAPLFFSFWPKTMRLPAHANLKYLYCTYSLSFTDRWKVNFNTSIL